MRGWRRGVGLRKWAGLVACLAALLATQPAFARADRHHHAYLPRPAAPREDVAPPSAGFGPTSAGVSTILIDAMSGRVLEESGADVPRYPASLTKLMTLDLAFQALRDGRMTLDTEIPVSYHAAAVEPVKLGLQPGDEITVHQAILAMTTMSANDAATALGEYLGGGSEARCAQMMTLRAHALGMAQTAFYNASGLPNPSQITTARDLAILARDIVVNYPEDQPFFEVQAFDFNGRMVVSNNEMLKLYPGVTGMKTGYTILARHNLVTSAERGGRVLIGVTLHEPSWGASYEDMTAMLNSGFGLRLTWPDAAVAVAPAPARSVAAAGWTAQFGVYTRMSRARRIALEARRLRGAGIARVARVQVHGRELWTAQLGGLSLTAAHETCAALSARGAACRVVRPAEHMA